MPDTQPTADSEFDPAAEPGKAAPWLNLLEDAEEKFRDWQERADNTDKLFADLQRQASNTRDAEFAMFWANVQVLGPSVYSRKPVPVVVPEFKDRDPVKRQASEMLERALIKTFDLDDINGTMLPCRDDMLVVGRGVIWVRYEKDGKGQRVCIEFLDRKDFRHEPARIWKDVDWVARRGWMTRKEIKARFRKLKAEVINGIDFNVQGDRGRDSQPKEGSAPVEKAGVWEIWHRGENKVVWVTEGCEDILEEGKPHHDLEGFFPCPKPAYTTVQRRTLIPIPDVAYYKDQLDEINKLTARIHALTEAVQVKGFYPGGGEIGAAVEAALNINDDRKIMVPVSNFAAFGSGGDPIVWMPVDTIVTTVAALIEARRQVIEDVYQIVGLSDIMRGSTEKDETATAQQLKSQYGSIRIRDKQMELVRIARDAARIAGEIMAENFSQETLLDLSQMTFPTRAEIREQVAAIEKAVEGQAGQIDEQLRSPEAMRMAEQDPEQAQQALAQLQEQAGAALEQAQAQIDELEATPTIEDVMALLRDQRIRPFALDIETDSTIQPDEDAEKQRRAEFLQVFGTTMQQLAELVTAKPQASEFAGEILKFALQPYRVGRQLEGAIDKFVEQLQATAGDGQQESPEAIKAKAEAEARQAEMEMKQAELESKAGLEREKMENDREMAREKAMLDDQAAERDAQRKERESRQKMQLEGQKHEGEMAKLQLEIQKITMEMQARQQDAAMRQRESEQQIALQRETAERAFAMDERRAASEESRAERGFEREGKAMERTAAAKAGGQGGAAAGR